MYTHKSDIGARQQKFGGTIERIQDGGYKKNDDS